MRIVISIFILSLAIVTGGAVLASFTSAAPERSRPALDAAVSIDTRELTIKAGSLPLQQVDHLI
jgi:hypothetical protein